MPQRPLSGNLCVRRPLEREARQTVAVSPVIEYPDPHSTTPHNTHQPAHALGRYSQSPLQREPKGDTSGVGSVLQCAAAHHKKKPLH